MLAERVTLKLRERMSGIATLARAFVENIRGMRAVIAQDLG